MTKLPHPLCPVGTGAEHSAHTDGTVTCAGFSEVRCEHPDNEPCIPHTTRTASDQDTATLFDEQPAMLGAFGVDMGLFA